MSRESFVSVGILLLVALVGLLGFSEVLSSDKTCKSEEPDLITLDTLKAKWPHYRFTSESASKSDFKKEAQKRGYNSSDIRWGSWNSSHSGPGEDYDEVYHMVVSGKRATDKDWGHLPSQFKIKVCKESSSGTTTLWMYGWDENRDFD